jgi:hypothetical protein
MKQELTEVNRHKATVQAAMAIMAFLGYDNYIPRLIELYGDPSSDDSMPYCGRKKAIGKADRE